MYLGRDTEATPELQNHILAFNPEKIKNYWPFAAPHYLTGLLNLVRLLIFRLSYTYSQ